MTKCNNPIIIGGSGSSGSTLLATILNRHPEIIIGPELSLFNKPIIYKNYDVFKRNINDILDSGLSTRGWFLYWETLKDLEKFGWKKKDLLKIVSSSKNNVEFIDKFFEKSLIKEQKIIWGEKTPSNSYYFDSFINLYPKGRIIHIHRDYRDVVSSLKNRGMSSYFASMVYLYNCSMALRCQEMKNYYDISYEFLVSKPEAALKDLCNFLEITYYSELMDGSSKDNSKKLHSWNNDPSGKISSDSISGEKRNLSNYDYFVFNHIRISETHKKKFNLELDSIKKINNVLGYDNETDSFSIIIRLLFSIRLTLSMLLDLLKRYIVMLYIDKKIYHTPGKIKFW